MDDSKVSVVNAENVSFGLLVAAGVILVVLIVALCFLIVKRKEQRRCERRTQLRRLWYDHVVYTRLYLMARFTPSLATAHTSATASAGGLSTLAASDYATRLLRNQQEIGAAFASKYGHAAGQQVAKLLTEHISGAVAIVDAMLAQPPVQAIIDAAIAAWYTNAGQIADALAHLNPKQFRAAEAHTMMNMHLDATLREATLLQAKSTAGGITDIANFDRIVTEIESMADWIAEGMYR